MLVKYTNIAALLKRFTVVIHFIIHGSHVTPKNALWFLVHTSEGKTTRYSGI